MGLVLEYKSSRFTKTVTRCDVYVFRHSCFDVRSVHRICCLSFCHDFYNFSRRMWVKYFSLRNDIFLPRFYSFIELLRTKIKLKYKLRQWATWSTLALFYNTSITFLHMFRVLNAHLQEDELYWCSIWYRPLSQWPSGAQVERELRHYDRFISVLTCIISFRK